MVKDINHWNSFRKGAPRDVTLFHLRAEKMIIRVLPQINLIRSINGLVINGYVLNNFQLNSRN